MITHFPSLQTGTVTFVIRQVQEIWSFAGFNVQNMIHTRWPVNNGMQWHLWSLYTFLLFDEKPKLS